jgi:hypothetical protein
MTWSVYSADGKFHWLRDGDGHVIAASEDERRIRLLGAAPLMLEALEAIAELDPAFWCEVPEEGIVAVCDQCKEIARAAIAAVKGESDEDVENHNDELA